MDAAGIASASTYVNNLLLARGLLRDGKSIHFERLSGHNGSSRHDGGRRRKEEARIQHDDGKDEGSTKITAQVLNLIHELVLKQDRTQTSQESLSHTLATLRGDLSDSTATITRLTTQNDSLSRQLALSSSTTTAAVAAQRTAESTIRTLKEELVRTKATLTQVRTQCANDIRKRDVQIQKIKGFLTDRQRGSGKAGMSGGGIVGPTITITGTGGSNRSTGSRGGSRTASSNRATSATSDRGRSVDAEDKDHAILSVQDAGYTLQQETNEFLTQLSQGLSDENDALISLIQNTLSTLRDIQGVNNDADKATIDHLPYGPNDSGISIPTVDSNTAYVQVVAPNVEGLAREISSHLTNLRELLTNPSFAPVEEVQIREEEIQRLREGWEKMEARWKDAVSMMMKWRQRMAGAESGNETQDDAWKAEKEEMDELTRGLDIDLEDLGIHKHEEAQDEEELTKLAGGEETLAEDTIDESHADLSELPSSRSTPELHELEAPRFPRPHTIDLSNIAEESNVEETLIHHHSEQPSSSSPPLSSPSPTRAMSTIPPIPSRSPLRYSTALRSKSNDNFAGMDGNGNAEEMSAVKPRSRGFGAGFGRRVSFAQENEGMDDDVDELG